MRNDTQAIFKKIVTAGFSVQSSRVFRGSNKSTLFLRHANPSTDTQIKRSLTVNKSNSQKHCNTSSFRRVLNDRVYRLQKFLYLKWVCTVKVYSIQENGGTLHGNICYILLDTVGVCRPLSDFFGAFILFVRYKLSIKFIALII